MTDATTQSHRQGNHQGNHQGNRHAHDHAGDGAVHGHGRAAPVRPSLLEASAGARLLMLSPPIAALWAGVFWALH